MDGLEFVHVDARQERGGEATEERVRDLVRDLLADQRRVAVTLERHLYVAVDAALALARGPPVGLVLCDPVRAVEAHAGHLVRPLVGGRGPCTSYCVSRTSTRLGKISAGFSGAPPHAWSARLTSDGRHLAPRQASEPEARRPSGPPRPSRHRGGGTYS